jgi:hypothetical protein
LSLDFIESVLQILLDRELKGYEARSDRHNRPPEVPSFINPIAPVFQAVRMLNVIHTAPSHRLARSSSNDDLSAYRKHQDEFGSFVPNLLRSMGHQQYIPPDALYQERIKRLAMCRARSSIIAGA